MPDSDTPPDSSIESVKTAPLAVITETQSHDAASSDSALDETASSELPAQETVDTAPTPAPAPRKRRYLLWGVVSFVVIGNIAMAGASVYLSRHKANGNSQSITSASGKTKDKQSGKSTGPQTKTLHYVSDSLNLEFDYPIEWRLSALANDSMIQITSAKISVTDYKGVNRTGTLDIFIASKNSGDTFGYIPQDAAAAADSITVTYKNPSTVQRSVTNLSYLQSSVDTSDTAPTVGANPADTVLVTGNLAYKKGQPMAAQNFQAIDPHIYAYISSCPGVRCDAVFTAPVPVDTWQKDPILSEFKNLVASMRITK